MRRSLRVAVAAVAALSLSFGTAAHADPNLCGQPSPSCEGKHCHAGDTFYLVVTGPGHVQGTALCGDDRAFCDEFDGNCSDSNVAQEDSALGCDLSVGEQATCFTVGSGVPNAVQELIRAIVEAINDFEHAVADPLLCPLLITLAPIVNPLTLQLHIDPDGDTWVGFTRVYDCPPYY